LVNIRTHKEGDSWRIRTNKEIKDIFQGADIVKFIKFSRIRWYGHVERMQNQRMPKQTAAVTTEGTRKRGRPGKRWKDEVEEDLNIMGEKKLACSGQGSSEMEEDCIANQGSQRTVALKKKKQLGCHGYHGT
jgi:hypothetical protein